MSNTPITNYMTSKLWDKPVPHADIIPIHNVERMTTHI